MKKIVLLHGPFNTRSGYGDHARSIFYALYDSKKYDIKVLDCRWGDTPRNHLKKNNPRHKQLLDCFLQEFKLDRQPDIYVDIRIPNEFEMLGKFNIGITAGIETNAVSQKWIEGCNKMDLIIVPSEHSKDGFVNTFYDQVERLPDGQEQKTGEHKLQKPIEVIFEGIDENVFKQVQVKDISKSILKIVNDVIKENFAYLFVGQWVKGGYGEDRKDIARLIKVFCETFANMKKIPALILKTSGASFSTIDNYDISNKIKSMKDQFPPDWKLPSIYLLHGDLTEDELNDLYNHPKVKYMISFSHGEGFGRPLLEASMVGLPIITPQWSGPVDFLSPQYTSFVKGNLESVPKGALWDDIVIPESSWFTIDEHHAYTLLQKSFGNYYEAKNKAKIMMRHNRKKYTYDKMLHLINKVVDKYMESAPTPVSLNLPKLKKVDEALQSTPDLKLPSLKKIT